MICSKRLQSDRPHKRLSVLALVCACLPRSLRGLFALNLVKIALRTCIVGGRTEIVHGRRGRGGYGRREAINHAAAAAVVPSYPILFER